MTRLRRTTSLLAVLLVLAGCSDDVGSSGDAGFVSGKGIITRLAVEDRERPGEVSGETLEGEPISLEDYAGKTVVLNVWGSWCAPCRSEAPDLVAASEELADLDVVFLGINSRDLDKAAAQAFQRRFEVPYPSIYDQKGETLLAFRGTLSPNAIPSTVVVDADGRVAASVIGEVSRSTLVGLVEDVVAGEGWMVPLDLGDWFAGTALSGSMLLAVPVALVAGLVSFFSPCVVPLLPGYLSYATGLSGADLESAGRGRMVAGSALFVLGFSTVFVALGTASGAMGDWLIVYSREISVVLGAFTILVGVAFLGLVPWMQRDVRIHRVPAVGLVAAPLLGVLFGLGWTPCIGPTLSAVQVLAFQEGTAGRGALLSAFYSLGLGLPFIAAGLAFRRMLGAVRWVRRHQAWVTRTGGVMMILVGVLLVSGVWDLWVAYLRGWIGSFSVVV